MSRDLSCLYRRCDTAEVNRPNRRGVPVAGRLHGGIVAVLAIFLGLLVLDDTRAMPVEAYVSEDTYPASDPNNNGNWVLHAGMSDEFNGTELDTSKWKTFTGCSRAPRWCWDKEQVKFGYGALILEMAYTDDLGDVHYKSGIVRSDQGTHKYIKHGYLEARIKGTAVPQNVPSAFWMWRDQGDMQTEVDIVEIQQRWPFHIGQSRVVWEDNSDSRTIREYHKWSSDWFPGADFHVYGLEWDSQGMRWYVDGKMTRSMPSKPYFTQEMIVILSLGLREPYISNPSPDDFPTHMSVDYIRVWKHGEVTPVDAVDTAVQLLREVVGQLV